MVWGRRRFFNGGSIFKLGSVVVFRTSDGSSVLIVINGGADDSSAINGGSVLLIVNGGAIDGSSDDRCAIDRSSRICGMWLLLWVLGKQWCVLRRVQGFLRPLSPIQMVR